MAALSVVVWHWQHFFASGTELATDFHREAQPLYDAFRLFYRYGDLAVDLFFSLSGFIFFWLYAGVVASRRLAPGAFFILRFSRLYPLHLATLLLVAIGQAFYASINGHSFIYPQNDAWHFGLNLFFLQSVGLEQGNSYNNPAWSVSVEVVLYAVFFAVCWFRLHRPWFLLLASLLGFFVLTRVYAPLGGGIGSFFMGGVFHAIFAAIIRRPDNRAMTRGVATTTLALWSAVVFSVYAGSPLRDPLVAWMIQVVFPCLILFPLTILTLALLEQGGSRFARALSPLGEISYSSYLIHFPLQLAFVLGAQAAGLQRSVFYTALSFILYFAVLFALSFASFRYLEMPAQRYLRGKWLRRERACSSARAAGSP